MAQRFRRLCFAPGAAFRRRLCFDPPAVTVSFGPLTFRLLSLRSISEQPMTVHEYELAQSLTDKPVKGMLTGGCRGPRGALLWRAGAGAGSTRPATNS